MYECPTCHRPFWNEAEVLSHIQKEHPARGGKQEGSTPSPRTQDPNPT